MAQLTISLVDDGVTAAIAAASAAVDALSQLECDRATELLCELRDLLVDPSQLFCFDADDAAGSAARGTMTLKPTDCFLDFLSAARAIQRDCGVVDDAGH